MLGASGFSAHTLQTMTSTSKNNSRYISNIPSMPTTQKSHNFESVPTPKPVTCHHLSLPVVCCENYVNFKTNVNLQLLMKLYGYLRNNKPHTLENNT
jgi:hypothetical protein